MICLRRPVRVTLLNALFALSLSLRSLDSGRAVAQDWGAADRATKRLAPSALRAIPAACTVGIGATWLYDSADCWFDAARECYQRAFHFPRSGGLGCLVLCSAEIDDSGVSCRFSCKCRGTWFLAGYQLPPRTRRRSHRILAPHQRSGREVHPRTLPGGQWSKATADRP